MIPDDWGQMCPIEVPGPKKDNISSIYSPCLTLYWKYIVLLTAPFIRGAGIGTINYEDPWGIPFSTKDGMSMIRVHDFLMFLSSKDKLDYFDPNFRKTKQWRSMISI